MVARLLDSCLDLQSLAVDGRRIRFFFLLPTITADGAFTVAETERNVFMTEE